MNLESVRYKRCTECGRFHPMAHIVPNIIVERKDYIADNYKAHKNKRCSPCIRAEIERLKTNGSREAMTRMCKLQKQVTA